MSNQIHTCPYDGRPLAAPVPDGAVPAEAWLYHGSYIILGSPTVESGHNCDEMGCSSFDHVVACVPTAERRMGRAAFVQGMMPTDNPFPEGDCAHDSWHHGYVDADAAEAGETDESPCTRRAFT